MLYIVYILVFYNNFSTSRTMATYDPLHNSQESLESSLESSRDSGKSVSYKLQRRLEQNRKAAQKSRLKKKAYVRELELGQLKMAKLEQEIKRTREQAVYMDLSNTIHGLLPGNVNSGIFAFEKKYDLWVIEQHKKECKLVTVLESDVNDVELRVFIDGVVNHYHDLFRLKEDVAKADAFSLLFGSWISPVERLFQWLGGFRPSEILYILMSSFEPLMDTQIVDLSKLRHTCRQAEDALTQGIDKLQQTLAQSVALNLPEGGNYDTYMSSTIGELEALENFLNQADHLRHRTLQQIPRILTMRQAARGLLALGEYFHRLRILNSLWSAQSRGIDPDEERRILAKEKKASMESFNNTLKRHTLVLRKRDLMRKKVDEEQKKLVTNNLLAAEGLELASEEDDDSS